MSIKPEDILPDHVNSFEVNGVTVRKATVGAVIANANILASSHASMDEKQKAKESIQALIPSLVAIGMHEHVVWKNPDIQKMINNAVLEQNISK